VSRDESRRNYHGYATDFLLAKKVCRKTWLSTVSSQNRLRWDGFHLAVEVEQQSDLALCKRGAGKNGWLRSSWKYLKNRKKGPEPGEEQPCAPVQVGSDLLESSSGERDWECWGTTG